MTGTDETQDPTGLPSVVDPVTGIRVHLQATDDPDYPDLVFYGRSGLALGEDDDWDLLYERVVDLHRAGQET